MIAAQYLKGTGLCGKLKTNPTPMRKLFLLFLLFLSFIVEAQPPCGFDDVHNRLMARDPDYARKVLENDVALREYITAHPELRSSNRPEAAYIIPVVVHVMHTGGAVGTIYNPSDAQITGAIDYLNQVFAGTYPGMTPPSGGSSVVDLEIQFALAQRTPSCGATNGINRVDASSLPNYSAFGVNVNNSNGCPELTLKNFSRWDPANYYNIWIVNKLDGADGTSGQFIAGFAYFPGASSSLDGTVMLATQMMAGEKTLPHEIGHALNLYHPFQGSSNNTQCPTNSNCATDGDRICDTDPISNNYNAGTGLYSFACRTGANSCASPNSYSINTESNFMSYTNCYTLFTTDQKARVQAAMTLASRSGLVDPSNLALVPCGTTINFSQATGGLTEDITGTLTGCRRYRDYSYQMSIGAAPSATAIATLTFSGTATQGLDYDITTNGNFSIPDNTLTFAAGATNPQSFTVRIYDDGSVESAETIILDFTVDNGGGDAVKGTSTPTQILTITDNDFSPVGTSTGTMSVGSIVSYVTGAPFDARLQQQRSQYLYKASELIAAEISAGDITALQLYVYSKLSSRPFTNLTIKMGQTTTANLVDGSVTVISGLTTVYTTASYSTIAGWNTFSFSTPFTWNGTSNLVIEICFENSSADAGNAADQVGTYADGGTASQGNMFFQNTINCSGSFSSVSYYGNGIKPIIQLSASVTGTPIETAAATTSALHISNGSQDYFYSNNNKLLARLNNVSASLGCVTTGIEEAGTNWVNAFGGQRSAKVFTITPTTNVSTTSYSITLYFENTELAGKNPATLRIAKTTAASAAAATSANTVFMNPTITQLGSGTTAFTASFTGFSKFFLVDAGATLPVTLLVFTGTARENGTVLQWATATEENNRHFELEMSNDGISFAPLATIPSKGNSTNAQDYEYTHVRPATGITWYRLKQVDFDGAFKYSRIIAVEIKKGELQPFIYPVPGRESITLNFGTVISAADIEILTIDMKLVRRETRRGTMIKTELSVSDLKPGLYLIRVNRKERTDVLRFIKEN